MPAPGSTILSVRGDGPWRGLTTQSLTERGDRRQRLIQNAYVTKDGSEIRSMWGWKTVVDCVTLGREGGFQKNITNASRAAYSASGGYNQLNLSPNENQKVWSPVAHLHSLNFVHGRTILVGETTFQREPIFVGGGPTEIKVTAWERVAGVAVLTIDNGWTETGSDGRPEGLFNALAPDGTATTHAAIPSHVYIEAGATGTGPLTELTGKVHEVDTSDSTNTQITLTTTVSAAGTFDAPYATISRVRPMIGATYPATATAGIDDPQQLTIFTLLDKLSADTLITDCEPAHVANRMRDFGDQTGNVVDGFATNKAVSRRRMKRLPYRTNPAVSGDRLLLGAPGYGCVFQCPVISGLQEEFRYNDVFDRPRSAGVPKAVMWEDTSASPSGSWHTGGSAAAGTAYGGSDASVTARNGTYKVKVAYKDDATGEIGLASEPITITTTTGTTFQGLRIAVIFPGYLMPETLALSILVFRTAKEGSEYFYQQTITLPTSVVGGTRTAGKYGITPNDVSDTLTGYEWCVTFNIPYVTDDKLDTTFGPDPLVQMPMGSDAVRTIRAATFYGGQTGFYGDRRELYESVGWLKFDGSTAKATNDYPDRDRLTMTLGNGVATTIPPNGPWLGAGATLPPAYAGQKMASLQLFPYPVTLVQLDKLVNARSAGIAGLGNGPVGTDVDPEWTILKTPLMDGASWDNTQPAWLVMPQGKYQISLTGNPTVTPAIQTLDTDSSNERNITGIGEVAGSAVICTRDKTYMAQWSNDAAANQVEIANANFGCIATNSMVEFEGGCAYISERGPFAITSNGPDWIGQDLEQWFTGDQARYLRDNDGLMRNAWACHDPERGLIYFGVTKVRLYESPVTWLGEPVSWATANTEAQSRFPCNEVLIYNYRMRSWSVWTPPLNFGILWMTRGVDYLGTPRIFFLASDMRVYVADDTFSQGNKQTLKRVVASYDSGTVTATLTGAIGDDVTARGSGDNLVFIGQTVMFTDTTEKILRGTATIGGYDTSAGTILISANIALVAGDIAWIGAKESQLITNHLKFNSDNSPTTNRTVGLRYSLWSDQAAGGDTTQSQPTFARPLARVNKRFNDQDGNPPSVQTNLAADLSTTEFHYLGYTAAITMTRDMKLNRSIAIGQEHELTLDIITAGQFRLADVSLEVP